MTTKIAILDAGYKTYDYEKKLFSDKGYGLSIYTGPLRNRDQKYRLGKDAHGILVRELLIDEKALELMPGLKAIVRYGVGFDNIDLDACRKRNIRVANVQGYANHSVSDHALALMFGCIRDLERSRIGTFSKPSRPDMFELHDKTMGIIGLGRIGSQFALKVAPLFKRILAYDPYKSNDYMQTFGAKKVDLSTLLRQSHVISLHCNLSSETRHILDENAFHGMKQIPVILNTSRGAVVDEKALLQALETGGVHSAGLDVFEQEPPAADQEMLLAHPKVLHTPHVAWYSETSVQTLQRTAAHHLLALLEGKAIEDELT